MDTVSSMNVKTHDGIEISHDRPIRGESWYSNVNATYFYIDAHDFINMTSSMVYLLCKRKIDVMLTNLHCTDHSFYTYVKY